MLPPEIPGYQELKLLGEGGFGRVYRALHAATGRTFAIKLVQLVGLDEDREPERIARFERELSICGELYHPNIVGLVDQGSVNGVPYAVFEYVDGITLAESIRRFGALQATRAGELMAQVLDALACAHERGIVHRDLKPTNVMVTSTGARSAAKVLDFGIGTFLPSARRPDEPTLTGTFDMLGTPAYASPEQLRGDPVTERSDLYAWGLVFLECLTGERAVAGVTPAAVYQQQLCPNEISLPPAIQRHPIARVLRRALRKNSRRRARSAAELLGELEKTYLGDLVGDLGEGSVRERSKRDDGTWVGSLGSAARRQVTVLSFSISIMPEPGARGDSEVLGALLSDQVAACVERCAEFGGRVAGVLGNRVLVHFGASRATDASARLALRTAATLTRDVAERGARLMASRGVRVEIRAGLDTGMVQVARDGSITGLTDSVASRLEELAPPGTVAASETLYWAGRRHAQFTAIEERSLPGQSVAAMTYALVDAPSVEVDVDSPPTELPLVGRSAELEALDERLRALTAGGGSGLLLQGEPGVGKSRLLRELRRRATKCRLRTYECHCLPELQNSALQPILELVRQHFGLHRAEPAAGAGELLERGVAPLHVDASLSVPVLCLWLSLPLPPGHQALPHAPARQKQILFDTLLAVLEHAQGDAGLLLIVEDLHWADPTTLEFLSFAIRQAPLGKTLLALSARSRFESPFAQNEVATMELQRLDAAASEAVALQSVGGDGGIAPDALQLILERSDGVPLFIEEYTRMLVEQGALVVDGETYRLAPDRPVREVPVTLRDLLNERLERSGAMLETIQLAALMGREFDVHLLQAAATRAPSQVQMDLDVLHQLDLVHRNRDQAPGHYLFRHALIRDAARDGMPADSRRSGHARIAGAMESRIDAERPVQPAVVAEHFFGAENYAKAIEHGARAAAEALDRSVNEECITHTDRVLEWIGRLPVERRPAVELTIMELRARAIMASRGWASSDARECLERCRALLEHGENEDRAMATLCARFTYHYVASDRRDAGQLEGEFARRANKDSWAGAAAAFISGVNHHVEGRYAEADVALGRAADAYDERHPYNRSPIFGQDMLTWVTGLSGQVKWALGKGAEANEASERAVHLAKKAGHMPSLAMAMLHRAQLHQLQGNAPRVLESTSELLELTEKFGLAAYQGYGTVVRAWATGEEEPAAAVVSALGQMGCWVALTYHRALLVDLAVRKERYEAALSSADECLRLCDQIGERYYEADLHLLRSQALAGLEDWRAPSVVEGLRAAVFTAWRAQSRRTELRALTGIVERTGSGSEQEKRRLGELVAHVEDCVPITA